MTTRVERVARELRLIELECRAELFGEPMATDDWATIPQRLRDEYCCGRGDCSRSHGRGAGQVRRDAQPGP